jgi:hypothetical protein
MKYDIHRFDINMEKDQDKLKHQDGRYLQQYYLQSLQFIIP